MSDKKGLSAFLKKNQKKAKKTDVSEETQAQDAEVIATQDNGKSTQQSKTAEAGSSDEEEDELANGMSYGNIKEKKDITIAQTEDEKANAGYGFDTAAKKKTDTAPANKSAAMEKKTGGNITFGSRPTFSKGLNKGKFGGEFSEGLDDIDASGNTKKKTYQTRAPEEGVSAAAGGTREFINLGGGARARDEFGEEDKRQDYPVATGIKPTFKGRMNLTKTGGKPEDESSGVVTSYGFSVALRGPRTEDEQRTEEAGEGNKQVRRDPRKLGEKGVSFNQNKKDEEEEDHDFQVVKDKTKRTAFKAGEDSEEDNEFRVNRGGLRGGRGADRGTERGGFERGGRGGEREGFERGGRGGDREGYGGAERYGDRGGYRGGRADGEESFVRNTRTGDSYGANKEALSSVSGGSSGRGGFFKNSGRAAAKKEEL